MGEQAEYILNGDDCQECGQYIGKGDGFPRSCDDCKPTKKKITSGYFAVKGVENYLKSEKDKDSIIYAYGDTLSGMEVTGNKIKICEEIQKNFSKFVTWYHKRNKKS